MTAATAPASAASPPSRAITGAALALSLAVHLLAALVWLWPAVPGLPDDPPAVTVELVQPPPAPEPMPEPAPAAPPQPPPAERPKAIPQLDPAPVAARSTAPAALPVRRTAPTRSERDIVLSQVVRHWRPPPELMAFRDAEFAVTVTVRPDGSLGAPFAASAPYDPAAAIEGFAGLHPQDPQRRASESFYRALRQAQPLRLAPALAAKAPFTVVLNFRVRDVR